MNIFKMTIKQEDYNNFLEARFQGNGQLDRLIYKIIFDRLEKKLGKKKVRQIAINLDNMDINNKIIKSYIQMTYDGEQINNVRDYNIITVAEK